MLNCKEASELMSQQMDADLPFGKRMSLRVHLMMCHGCSNFLRQIQFLHKAAKHWRIHDTEAFPRLSDEARKRIASALHNVHVEDYSHRNNGEETS